VKILLTQAQLEEGVVRIARQLTAHYADRPLTIIGVMTGSIVLLADLIRRLEMPLRVGVVQARSYRGSATTAGPLVTNTEFLPDLAGRHVLLVDDIFDTGHTLAAMSAQLREMAPASLASAVLLRKRGRQQVALEPDFVAFEIPDEFVVGYGLDYDGAYRNLPYVAALEPAELAERPAP
jgi:hypoxanthine phosphoribosyltransferase